MLVLVVVWLTNQTHSYSLKPIFNEFCNLLQTSLSQTVDYRVIAGWLHEVTSTIFARYSLPAYFGHDSHAWQIVGSSLLQYDEPTHNICES
jgi:hypothetical protein